MVPFLTTVADCLVQPFVWGWFRGSIFVPRQFATTGTREQRQAILAHELAHVARWDAAANLVQIVAQALFFFHPLVWWANRQIRHERENCCDETVIAGLGVNPRQYSQAIVDTLVAEYESIQPVPSLAMSGRLKNIEGRIKTILNPNRRFLRRPSWTAVVTVVLLAACVVPTELVLTVRGEPMAAPTATPSAKSAAAGDKKVRKNEGNHEKASDMDTNTHSPMAMEQGECSLAGKVIDEVSGQPVSASMMLFYWPTFQAKVANTGADGAFIFKDIPDGTYSLQTVISRGHLPASCDPENRGGQHPKFRIAKGEHRRDIVLKVKPAYRISGRVLEPDGKPSHKGLRVYAWTPRNEYSGCDEVFGQYDPSNGTYVIDGLNGKPVYVSTMGRSARKEGDGTPLVYYPSTYCREEATLVHFDQARSVENIDIRLRNDRGLTLAGTVRDEAGDPIPEAFLVVHHRDMTLDVITTYTDKQGRYELSGLGKGEFLMHVDAAHRGFVPVGEVVDIDQDAPTTRHDVKLMRGVMVSGKFVDKHGNPWEIGQSGGMATVISAEDMLSSPLSNGLRILMLSQMDFDALAQQVTEGLTGQNKQKTRLPPAKKKSPAPDKSSDNKRRQHGGWTTHDDCRNKYRPEFIGTSPGMSLPRDEGPHTEYNMLFPSKSTFAFQAVLPGYTNFRFMPQKIGQKVAEIRYEGRDVKATGLVTKPGQEIRDLTIVIDTGK